MLVIVYWYKCFGRASRHRGRVVQGAAFRLQSSLAQVQILPMSLLYYPLYHVHMESWHYLLLCFTYHYFPTAFDWFWTHWLVQFHTFTPRHCGLVVQCNTFRLQPSLLAQVQILPISKSVLSLCHEGWTKCYDTFCLPLFSKTHQASMWVLFQTFFNEKQLLHCIFWYHKPGAPLTPPPLSATWIVAVQ